MRDTLGLLPSYPDEEDSTTIYRLMDADLIEELAGAEIRDPQSLPNSGAPVYMATDDEIVRTLGLLQEEGEGLYIGETVGGANVRIVLKRQAIQSHMFICGTTGSGKSYAMGVIAEELTAQGLPMVFIDTQDEYSTLVEKLGGKVVQPGTDFTIRVSSLTESELLDLLPAATTELQRDIVARAFSELQQELVSDNIAKFGIDQLTARIERVWPLLTTRPDSVSMALSRTASLKRNPIFGMGMDKADWRKIMHPCMAINCKRLTTTQLQPIATAVLRELQTLRLHDHIPPYVVVLDEAHLFVPDREASACKRIIREGVRIGRHHGICMVLMTQSPADIDKRAIRQCNTRLVFALEPDQLGAIRGAKSDASEEMLRALPKMPRGTCLLSGTYESVKHTIPVRIRLRTTQDSEGGETPDIFAEMRETWQPHIEALKRDQQ
ncbi:MAG: ATP-binding protein [Chloroflexia bacterium]